MDPGDGQVLDGNSDDYCDRCRIAVNRSIFIWRRNDLSILLFPQQHQDDGNHVHRNLAHDLVAIPSFEQDAYPAVRLPMDDGICNSILFPLQRQTRPRGRGGKVVLLHFLSSTSMDNICDSIFHVLGIKSITG